MKEAGERSPTTRLLAKLRSCILGLRRGSVLELWKHRAEVSGYRFVEQAPVLRHITARFGEAGKRGSN
jgi:hypothetical protein